jgi:hypothetical protein
VKKTVSKLFDIPQIFYTSSEAVGLCVIAVGGNRFLTLRSGDMVTSGEAATSFRSTTTESSVRLSTG